MRSSEPSTGMQGLQHVQALHWGVSRVQARRTATMHDVPVSRRSQEGAFVHLRTTATHRQWDMHTRSFRSCWHAPWHCYFNVTVGQQPLLQVA